MKLVQWLSARMKERSTWLGLVTIVAAIGLKMTPEQSESIVIVGLALGGLIAAFTKDSGALKSLAYLFLVGVFFAPANSFAADARISNSAAVAACDAIVDLVDAGSGAGKLRIYSGSAPTDVDASATGTLLAELTMSDPAFGACADANPGGRGTASSITADSSADATGTAGYFRVLDSNNVARIQGTVATSGADLNLTSTSISTGDSVSISSYTFTVPESN